MMNDYIPPAPEQWEHLPGYIRLYIFLLVWFSCCLPRLARLPVPIHFGLLSALCMFILTPIMPHHPLAIPTVIGGGLAGGLLLVGGDYERAAKE
jgi:hypothetical protein